MDGGCRERDCAAKVAVVAIFGIGCDCWIVVLVVSVVMVSVIYCVSSLWWRLLT